MTTRGVSNDAIVTYRHSVLYLVACLAEFRVGQALVQDNGQGGVSDHQTRYIVRSPEFAKNDLGFLVGRGLSEFRGKDDISKFVELEDSDVDSRPVVPLDTKSLMSRMMHGTAILGLNLRPQQIEMCEAIIIITPKEPNSVVLLPVHYLHEKEKACHDAGTSFYFLGRRVLWTLHPVPAFSPELTPFVLPFSDLRLAVADMRDYSIGSTREW